jgi:hypothetical protein
MAGSMVTTSFVSLSGGGRRIRLPSWKVRRLLAIEARHVFLVTALFGGLVMVAVTPPFQVPDEPAHFYRAYTISEGRLLVDSSRPIPGAMLPASLAVLVDTLIDDVPFHPERKIPAGAVSRARHVKLEPEARRYLHFMTAAQFTAIPYVPQAAAIAVGRWLGGSPLTLFYLARIGNLLVAVALIYLAISWLPGYRWLATLLALTPMAMFLRSSISADAGTTAIAFLLTAVVTKLAFGRSSSVRRRDFVVVAAAAAALSLAKPVYFPLVLTAAAIPASRIPLRRRRLVLLLLAAVAIAAVTTALVLALPTINSMAYAAELRIDDILSHPIHFTGLAATDLLGNAHRYGAQFVGRLGWLDTALPVPFLLGYAVVLLTFVAVDAEPKLVVTTWQRCAFTAAVIVSTIAIYGAMYLVLGRFTGMQGRYFHPLALTAVWALHVGRWGRIRWTRWRGAVVLVLALVSMAVTVHTVSTRYYGDADAAPDGDFRSRTHDHNGDKENG